MVLFGSHPNPGTLLKASQFLAEELPIRLSHRVKDLDELPDGLSEMEGVKRVKEWYAESFDELVSFPPPVLPPDIREALMGPSSSNGGGGGPSSSSSSQQAAAHFPSATDNPSLHFQMREGSQERDYDPQDTSEASGSGGARGLASGKYDYGNGNGSGNGTNGNGGGGGGGAALAAAATRMRIPIERR